MRVAFLFGWILMRMNRKGRRIMSSSILAIRVRRENRNHHLWDNNGTWFLHYTVHKPDFTKARVRQSLGTKSLVVARQRRNRFLGLRAAASLVRATACNC